MLISPSQISTWMLCERKWGWGYIDKIRSPSGAGAELGSKVHNLLEEYNKHGTPILDREVFNKKRPGKIAMRVLPHLPKPGTGIVEGAFRFKAHGHEWRGLIDLRLPPEIVIDFKTSVDPKKYGLTQETLPEDPQGIIYAAYAFSLDPKINRVILRWIYMHTGRDAPAKVVEATVTRDEVEARFKQLAQVADAVEAASHLSTLDLEPSPAACSAFGGCPHVQRCNLTNQQKLRGLFNMTEKISLADRMKEIKAKNASRKASTEPAPATAPVAQAINPPKSTIKAIEAITESKIKEFEDQLVESVQSKFPVLTETSFPEIEKAMNLPRTPVQPDIDAIADAVIKKLFARLGNLIAKGHG